MTEQPRRLAGRFTTARIVDRRDLTPEHWLMWLAPARPFTFKPGQYCTIGVQGIERPYSIASAPSEKHLELFIELIPPPHGRLTPLLHRLQVGDEVAMRPRAKGVFNLNPRYHNHVMVATVTGVTPFISMLRTHLDDRGRRDRFFVLEGASYQDEFGYYEELTKLASENENVEFVPTVSRPWHDRNRGWKGETGRVNTIVEKYLSLFAPPPEDTIVYLCGHPQMIEDVKRRLAGADYHIEEERFWKEDEEE